MASGLKSGPELQRCGPDLAHGCDTAPADVQYAPVIDTSERRFLAFTIRLTCAVFLVAGFARAQGSAHVDWATQRWKAQWIASPESAQRDAGVYHFRKIVETTELPKQFVVHVSADNRFVLFVNGTRVGEGPASSDLGHWKYETFDLRPFLHAGKNVIGATVWNFGTLAPVAQMTSRAGFVLQGDSAAEQAANTNESWQVEVERGQWASPTDFMALLKSYYAGPPGEIIDGRRYDWDWNALSNTTGMASNAWKKPILLGEGAARESRDTRTIWMLQPDALPHMEYTAVPVGRVVSSSGVTGEIAQTASLHVAAHTKATLLLDGGALTTAYPEVMLSGGRDARVRLTYA